MNEDDPTESVEIITERTWNFSFGNTIALFGISFSIAGLINQWALLNEFGLSLSDYADTDDFLVASINLLTSYNLYFCIVIVIFALIIYLLEKEAISKKWGEFYSRNKIRIAISVILVGPSLFGYVAALCSATGIKNGASCTVDVQLKLPGPVFKHQISPNSDLHLITALNSAIFIYERPKGSILFDKEEQNYIHVVPNAALGQMAYKDCNTPSFLQRMKYFFFW